MFITEQQNLSYLSKDFFDVLEPFLRVETNLADFMDTARAFCGL